MKSKKKELNIKPIVISILISALILTWGILTINHLSFRIVTNKLFYPLLKLLITIAVGLIAGEIIEGLGWTRILGYLTLPLFKFGNLGPFCSAAFTTAFASGVAANAMLLNYYEEKKISTTQLYLTNLVNQFPAYFLHLPTTFFIVIPLTGLAGAIYFAITFSSMIIRTFLFFLYGHLNPQQMIIESQDEVKQPEIPQGSKIKNILKGIKGKIGNRMLNITIYVVPIYIFVFVLNAKGIFELIRDVMTRYVVTKFLPIEALSVIMLSFIAEFSSGFAAAGAMRDAGVLTIKQTVLALLIGNIIAFPMRAIRHQLPRYIGIFSPKIGIKMLVMGQGFRVISLGFVGIIYFYIG
ncbi:MAG: nucleoside recognition protein [Desulfobacterales bacterium]|nr:nucleoside recognition protein [Desulfobacterales bacterium]